MSGGPGAAAALDRLRRLGVDLASTAFASAGVVLAAVGSRWALAVLALGVLVALARAVSMRREAPRLSLLTTQLAQRALLGAGVATALARTAGPLPAALGAVLLIGATMYEPYLRQGFAIAVPVVAHLPGVPRYRSTQDLSRQLLVGDLVALVLGLLVGAVGASAWWWALAAACALVTRVRIARDSRRRAAVLRQVEQGLAGAVAAYRPEVVLYTSWPTPDGSHQVTMWLPYLQRSGHRCLVITRNSVTANALADLVDVPVVEARGPADLDLLTPPSLRAAFYPNASSGNSLLIRYQQLTHVFLGHGDSDKPTSFNPTHAMYDRIFCAGPAAVRRYGEHGLAIAPDKFVVVGRPQVESIVPATEPVAQVAEPVVLYAPTWRGHVQETSLSSLPMGERIVAELVEAGATVLFRPHPFSRRYPEDVELIGRIQRLLATDRTRTGRPHRWGEEVEATLGLVDCFNASDALVADVSGVASDYLFSGKPYAMVAVNAEPEAFRATYPVARAAYVVHADLEDLAPTVKALLHEDPLAGTRWQQRVDYLGPFPDQGYASAFVDAVSTVVEGARLRSDSDDTVDADVWGPGQQPGQQSGEGGSDEPYEGPDRLPVPRPRKSSRNRLKKFRRRLVRPRRYSQLGAAASLLSLASALLGEPGLVTALLGLASLTAISWSVRPSVRRRARWSRLMGASRATRVVLLAVAVVAMPPGTSTAALAVVLVLLTAAIVAELHLNRAWGRLGLEVRNFPAIQTTLTEPVPRGLLPILSTVVVLLALVPAVLPVPVWVLVGAAVAVAGLLGVLLQRALARATRSVDSELELKEALTQLAPRFAVYFASTMGVSYQVGMWARYFARIGRPWIVVTRAHETLDELTQVLSAEGVRVPVILRPTLRGLEEVVVPSLSTVFYVNNAARNTHFVERRELTHVWLNHGDSEKPACYNPVHAIYDLIFVAGRAGVDRYARHHVEIPAEKFRVVGRPQVEDIEPLGEPSRAFTHELDQPADPRPTVLYAPTWQGPYANTRLFSLPVALGIVERLLESGVRVIFRVHPLNYRFPDCAAMVKRVNQRLSRDRRETGTPHLFGVAAEKAMTIEDCFNASDALITDVSAVVSDYLRSGKPFAIVAVGRTPEQLAVDAPAARAAYVLREDLSNLDEVLADLLGADPLAAARESTRVYYLGDFDSEHYAQGFLDEARRVID
ncbi:CDP-glycerol glycerophosphotransferase family protein [uncultured Friedmanniella sp.]|uniref:CDP-glycerol glycerophosphotransferase family protein n=1 Tax=uncultured Friedmanniella sp. TaxID=335381 RepID=UPI0035CA873C